MKKGFTLAEVLITLAIIGVVAALTIPSVILNTNQTEYRTALKKAVSVLNQAVSLQLALENISPSETTSAYELMNNIQGQMNTITSATNNCDPTDVADGNKIGDLANTACYFTTTDGMQFLLPQGTNGTYTCTGGDGCTGAGTQEACAAIEGCSWTQGGQCNFALGSKNIEDNTNPVHNACIMLVDVNGDKNPNKLTTDANAPSDRFYIQLGGSSGTTITPVGVASEIMFK